MGFFHRTGTRQGQHPSVSSLVVHQNVCALLPQRPPQEAFGPQELMEHIRLKCRLCTISPGRHLQTKPKHVSQQLSWQQLQLVCIHTKCRCVAILEPNLSAKFIMKFSIIPKIVVSCENLSYMGAQVLGGGMLLYRGDSAFRGSRKSRVLHNIVMERKLERQLL